MKNFKTIAVLLVAAMGVMFFLLSGKKTQLQQNRVIATSNFALYDVVKNIAGEKFEVVNILPFGVDPHSFEPTPKTIAQIEKAALFFYSGDMLEPWIAKFSLHVKRVDLSKHVTLLPLEHHEEEEEHEHHHHDGSYDPHYWLDFENMKKIANTVAEKLVEIGGENKVFYEKNLHAYLDKVAALEQQYAQTLQNCQKDTIVVSHNAFAYLAKEYDFKVESLSGISNESHTNAKRLQKILQDVQAKGIHVVFFEDFASHKEIETIANELSTVRIDKLQPLANITREDKVLHRDYFDLMESNLKKLSEALECH